MANKSPRNRNSARLAAVQALYEIEATNASVDPVLTEFLNQRWQDSVTDDDDQPVEISNFDQTLLQDIVEGVSAEILKLDEHIAGALSEQWTLGRLERLVRAILRAGTYELASRIDVPVRVVISEYMDVAQAFFSAGEPALINGVLDKLAKELRPHETK
jgi:transcription antitermination protein NusB